MAERMNQKLKILYLMKILLEKTDETHSITVQEMITALASYGITAERKSLYSDLESLRTYGLDVIGVQENRKDNELLVLDSLFFKILNNVLIEKIFF